MRSLDSTPWRASLRSSRALGDDAVELGEGLLALTGLVVEVAQLEAEDGAQGAIVAVLLEQTLEMADRLALLAAALGAGRRLAGR